MHPVSTRALLCALSTSAVALAGQAFAADAHAGLDAADAESEWADRPAIVVSGARAQDLPTVPGAVSVLDVEAVSNQHLTTLADLLGNQPGIFIEGAGNSGAPKISVRGSAIDEGHMFFRSGIFYELDGLPLSGTSGTAFELWNPQVFGRTDIYRGGAGLDEGAAHYGGAINFVTRTGEDASLLEGRVDLGSYDYRGVQVSSGNKSGAFDYYVSVSYFDADNFMTFDSSRATRVTLNLGLEASDAVKLRFIGHYAKAYEQSSYGITKAQVKNDPRVSSPLNVLDQSDRTNPGSYFFGVKADIDIDERSSLDVGFDYHRYPVYAYGNIFGSTDWDFNDIGFALRYKRQDRLFDRPSTTTFSVKGTRAINSWVTGYAANGGTLPYFTNPIATVNFDGAADVVFGVTNELDVTDRLTLSTALGGAFFRRVQRYSYYANSPTLPVNDARDTEWQGRIGARYEITPAIEAFGSLSRTAQAARNFDTVAIADGTYTLKAPLNPQASVTYELGLRGALGRISASISVYRADIRNELLGGKVNPTDIFTSVSNAPPTTRHGAEIGLNAILWQGELASNGGRSQLLLNQTYNYIKAEFDDKGLFAGNTLPAIPEHFWQGELLFRHDSGVYVGVNGKYSSAYFVDYANTFKNDAYFVTGASLGYSPRTGNWNAYLQVKNLFDKKYASSVMTQYDLAGQDADLVFYPGDGLSVFGGVSFRF